MRCSISFITDFDAGDVSGQVLAHPQYQADPIAAITAHLSSTLPSAPEPPKPKADPAVRKQQKARRKWEQKMQKRDVDEMTDD